MLGQQRQHGSRQASIVALALAIPLVTEAQSPVAPTGAPSGSPHPAPTATPAPVAVVCHPAKKPFDTPDLQLTGPWYADDGGIYYIRQLGNDIWWNGMSGREDIPSSWA